jgi:Transposase DNA-binding/Transposase DDE domain
MAGVELDVVQWAQQQFGACQLGDVRRTRRAVRLATQMAADPDGSTPVQTEKWADLKAAYRLLDSDQVTFERLAQPHWRETCERSSGVWLVLGDTTEINFGRYRQAEGLGPVGKNDGRGFLLHSGLMVDSQSEEVVGLAGQVIRHRRPKPKGEHYYQTLQRDRESAVWGQLIEQIGQPPEGTTFVHVFDRGADNFEVFCRLLLTGNDWVIRAARLNRKVDAHRELKDFLEELPAAGSYDLEVRATFKTPARTARLEVRHGATSLHAPHFRSPWLGKCGIESISMNVVTVREIDPPPGREPLSWVLLTSLPVKNFDDAWRVIGYYEKRWGIEEFHKALKTGCRLESRQLQSSARLEALAGLLSVVAVRLLQLRSLARSEPARPVDEVAPRAWVTVLGCIRPGRTLNTAGQFFRELAGLGGFLGRKHDGEPGWITLWRGFEKLQLALRAVRGYRQRCG